MQPPETSETTLERFVDHGRTPSTDTPLVVLFKFRLIDSVEIKKQMGDWPETFEARDFLVPASGKRWTAKWNVARASAGGDLSVKVSAIESSRVRMGLARLQRELGDEVIEQACTPKSVGTTEFVVRYVHAARNEGMATYASQDVRLPLDALGDSWFFAGAAKKARVDDVDEEELPVDAVAVVASGLPNAPACEIALALHGATGPQAEEAVRSGLGEDALALLDEQGTIAEAPAAADSTALLERDADGSLTLTRAGKRVLAAGVLAKLPQSHVAVLITKHHGGSVLDDALRRDMTAAIGTTNKVRLLQSLAIPANKPPLLTATSTRPKTWTLTPAGEQLVLPEVDLEPLLALPDAEAPPKEKADPPVSEPAAQPSRRLGELIARTSAMRQRCTVDKADVTARWRRLMQNADPGDTASAAEAATQMYAQAEREAASAASNGVLTTEVDALDANVARILGAALDAAEEQVAALEARFEGGGE